VVDAHNGFEVITSRIRTTKLSSLMWMVGFVTFFLSAILDNLTTTIVMVSLMKKLLGNREDRLFFAGIIVIAANAGGAWTPIGDVTTTMLWIGGQITAIEIMKGLILPSLVNLLVPLAVTARILGDRPVVPQKARENEDVFHTSAFESNLMFYLGLGILVMVSDLQDRHPPAALHGRVVRFGPVVGSGRYRAPPRGRSAQATPDAGARP
jgi:Na+/H+ antiporter NhaD/arsenite permease-like protein